MRIGITCHPTAGGSGIVATELGLALAERGHQVHFVTYEPLFRLHGFHADIICHLVEKVSYPVFQHTPFTLALTTKIADVAEEYGIEVWHAHYAIPHTTCALCAREMLPNDKRFKIVTTLHGTDITLVGSDPSFFRLTKYAIEQSDAVTAVSNWLAEETRKTFDLAQPIRTIYNFVNDERFRRKVRDRCELAPAQEKIVMHISNFRPVKRVTDVVRVFKRVSDQIPARLIMVGDGPEKISAMGVARQLGIADKIRYLGTYDDVECVLPCADLVFQPSEHESFGLVPLEAMACGVPVLGTASGGVCEVVEHGVTGYLCEVGDIESMTKCALEILTSPQRAREMGERSRKRVQKLFARDKIIGQYEDLYRDVLDAAG